MSITDDTHGLACLVLFVVCLAVQHFTAASLGPFYSFLLAAIIFFFGAALLVIVTWFMENQVSDQVKIELAMKLYSGGDQ